jgi:hypothetical protein
MLYNQAPLSFLDVNRDDYALVMMGVYESCDLSMAVDLFEWTYRRSQPFEPKRRVARYHL